MSAETKRLIRFSSSDCGKLRLFRESDLFGGTFPRHIALHDDIATVTKPCPSCGSFRPLRIQRPPEIVPNRALWALYPFPVRPSFN
jgi:hypothetical protein